MKKYLAIMKLGWLDAMEYRLEFLLGYLGWLVSFVIAVFVWLAVAAGGNGTVGNYDIKTMVTYLLIIQLLRAFIFSRAGFIINQDIQQGTLSNWMLKPISYLGSQFLIELANNTLRSLVGFVVFGIVLFYYNTELFYTFHVAKIFLSLVAILIAHTISFLIISIIALGAYWVVNANRFLFIYFSLLTIFSGMLIPIDLFPDNIAKILYLTPFPYVFFFPTSYILGTLNGEETLRALLIGSCYVLLLGLLLISINKAGIKKYEAVGK